MCMYIHLLPDFWLHAEENMAKRGKNDEGKVDRVKKEKYRSYRGLFVSLFCVQVAVEVKKKKAIELLRAWAPSKTILWKIHQEMNPSEFIKTH